MEITGWTWWDNPDYIDIVREERSKRIQILNKYPIPYRENIINNFCVLSEWYKNISLAFEDCGPNLANDAHDAVIKEIVDNEYFFTGLQHEYESTCCPIINNKYKYCLTASDWGRLMVECYPDIEYPISATWHNLTDKEIKIPQ